MFPAAQRCSDVSLEAVRQRSEFNGSSVAVETQQALPSSTCESVQRYDGIRIIVVKKINK